MEKTLVAVFESNSEAMKAQDKLKQAGISQSDITIKSASAMSGSSASSPPPRDEDEGGISGFFRSLFGSDDDEQASQYSEAMRRGNCMLTVRAQSDEQAEKASDILEDCGAIDVDERASQWRDEGWTPPVAAARPSDDRPSMKSSGDTQKLSVVQEDLKVGKRSVERGGVRVYTKVTDTPVDEKISLRDEKVSVQRNPVNRPATQADLSAMKDETIEMRETDEEAVVSKTARVTEEVEIGKKVQDREQVVRDKVRHTDVRVENLDEKETAPTAAQSGRPAAKTPKQPM